MRRQQKGWCVMISKKLKERPLYEWHEDKLFNKDAVAVIDKAARRLVLVMRSLEAEGVMTSEDIEDCVIRAMEKAEFLYYGMSKAELMQIVDKEINNDNGRKKYREGV